MLSEDELREYRQAHAKPPPEDIRSREIQFVNDFDKTGLTDEQIRATRQALRQEFINSLTPEELREYEAMQRKDDGERGKIRDEVQLPEVVEVLPEVVEVVAQQNSKGMSTLQKELVLERKEEKVRKAKKAGIDVKERPASFRGIEKVRARTLRTVVEPKFQVPRHVDTMVREMRDVNPTRVTVSMLAQASQLSQTPVTGRTFFPPQNANPTIVHPWSARFAPPTKPLPTYMNWAERL